MSAEDKASGKAQKITITSDKARLSQDEIDRMVKEAEENAEIDRIAKQNVEAKNQLEAYLYNLRASVTDTLKDKISAADKETLDAKITEALTWLEENTNQEKEAYDNKRKEVEDLANPIIAQAYNASPGAPPTNPEEPPSPGDSPSSESSGPTVEEL